MTDILGHSGRWQPGNALPPGIDPLESRLRETLEAIDRKRLARLNAFRFRIAVAGIAVVMASALALLAYTGVLGHGLGRLHFGLYFLAPLAVVGVLAQWVDEPRRDYGSDYKSRVVPEIASTLGHFDYFEYGWIDPDLIIGSTLIPVHDNCHSEDLFRGTYAGIGVELAEVRLSKIQHGPDRKTVVVFKGVFVLMSTDKTYAGRTVVRRDAGAISNWLAGSVGGLERVVLEDPEFEDQFEVYASDQVEARFLLSPDFMERLSALASDMGDGRLQAAFYDDKLFVMVPNARNLFEPPSIFTSVLTDAGIACIARELSGVLSMVDTLLPDRRTGL